jgi:putative hydrolase of the HAD superfamily
LDVSVLSADHGIRKPDRAIFQLALKQMGLAASKCVFADDTEEKLWTAYQLG